MSQAPIPAAAHTTRASESVAASPSTRLVMKSEQLRGTESSYSTLTALSRAARSVGPDKSDSWAAEAARVKGNCSPLIRRDVVQLSSFCASTPVCTLLPPYSPITPAFSDLARDWLTFVIPRSRLLTDYLCCTIKPSFSSPRLPDCPSLVASLSVAVHFFSLLFLNHIPSRQWPHQNLPSALSAPSPRVPAFSDPASQSAICP